MKAIVLVGGFGTRLRPLTLTTPKQMLPIVDRPMIEWVLAHLAEHGVDEAVLSLGYRPDRFLQRYVDGVCAGVRLRYAVEDEPLDTAGAVGFAARHAGVDERFVVVNGDVLTDLDVTALVRFHERAGAEATIHLTPADDPSRYGVVPVDEQGRVVEFVEKPAPGAAPSRWINAGTYVLEPSVIDRIPEQGPCSIERVTFPQMALDGCLYALESEEYWVDAGTPETYLRAQLDLVAGMRELGVPPPAVASTADLAPGAEVVDSVLMGDVEVATGAVVERSVVLPGVVVGAAATIRDSVVGTGAVVGADAVLEELTVIGEGETVAPGVHLRDARLPEVGE